MRLQPKKQPLVGIDISSTGVKVLQLSQAGDRYRIDHYAIEPLPMGAVVDGNVVNTEQVGEAIARALKAANCKLKHAALAVGGSGVITKIIQVSGNLSELSEEEIEDQVQVEAGNHIPFAVDDVRMDFEVIGQSKLQEGFVDVLLAAARKENVDTRVEAAEAADVIVEVMDLEQLVVENAFSLVAEQFKLPESGVYALIDIGAQSTALTVLKDGRSIYTREQAFGARQLQEEIMRRHGTSIEDAQIRLREWKFDPSFEEEIVEPFRENLVQQINRLLQFFYAGGDINHVDRVLLAGGGAGTHGLCEMLEERLGVPCTQAAPTSHMSLGPGVKAQDLAADAPALFIAVGLALRSFR